jgi:fermentation-respiration switch protein FrsA (DUF1100 family)
VREDGRVRQPTPRTAEESGEHEGLAWELWLPPSAPPWPGVVVIHGAGSCKERHADFSRLASGLGWAALAYDQRGHGASEGDFAPRVIDDAAAMARLLGQREGVDAGRVCVRGSSLGGFVAIHAAAVTPAIRGVAAICPAGEQMLIRGLREDRLEMRVDRDATAAWLGEHDLRDAVELMGSKPLILLQAEGDERVPAAWTRELADRALEPKRLIVVPGGHHGSVQHDAELNGVALDWLERRV